MGLSPQHLAAWKAPIPCYSPLAGVRRGGQGAWGGCGCFSFRALGLRRQLVEERAAVSVCPSALTPGYLRRWERNTRHLRLWSFSGKCNRKGTRPRERPPRRTGPEISPGSTRLGTGGLCPGWAPRAASRGSVHPAWARLAGAPGHLAPRDRHLVAVCRHSALSGGAAPTAPTWTLGCRPNSGRRKVCSRVTNGRPEQGQNETRHSEMSGCAYAYIDFKHFVFYRYFLKSSNHGEMQKQLSPEAQKLHVCR